MFESVIGLEVHVQLNTKSKIFCSCSTLFGNSPNTNVCPVCLGLPGALPVLNKEVIKKALKFASAIGANINKRSILSRKNYFYPDLPKGYQISQFDFPIVENGYLEISPDKKIKIRRAHIEEDAGKNIHSEYCSKVDLNRAGTPLLEIVSDPDLRSSSDALLYLKKLHSIVRYLDISDANMQEGSFRCDVNVSIRPKGDNRLLTRVEVKNLNSFKFIQKAIDYEVSRQIDAYKNGRYSDITQQTRLFDIDSKTTKDMRSKEDSADYRYFPDPDLLPISICDAMLKDAKDIPELPDDKRDRYVKEYGIREYDADIIVSSVDMAYFFEEMISYKVDPILGVKWLTVELLGRLRASSVEIKESTITPKKLAQIVKNIKSEAISNKAAKIVLEYLLENDVCTKKAIDKLGLKQLDDDDKIRDLVADVLGENRSKVLEYNGGKTKLFGFFMGEALKKSNQNANPAKVSKFLKQALLNSKDTL